MTICNMSIEAGARAGMIAPDDTTFAYLEGRPAAPKGADVGAALDDWRALASDSGRRVRQRGRRSTSPSSPRRSRGGRTRRWSSRSTASRAGSRRASPTRDEREAAERALAYMGLEPGHADAGHLRRPRLHRLVHELAHRGPARRGGGRRRASTCIRRVRAMVVPGLGDGQAAGRGGGPRPGLPRRRLRVAPRGLLDVPRDEPRRARRRASAALRRRTATSRAGRAGAAARTSSARSWPPRPRSPATSSTRASWWRRHEAVSPHHRTASPCSTARTSTPTRSSRSSS